MAPGVGWDDALAANKEKRFFNHSANTVIKTVSLYCFWEVKGVISDEEFQEFIDGASRQDFGKDVIMKICKPIDKALMNLQATYQSVFS